MTGGRFVGCYSMELTMHNSHSAYEDTGWLAVKLAPGLLQFSGRKFCIDQQRIPENNL